LNITASRWYSEDLTTLNQSSNSRRDVVGKWLIGVPEAEDNEWKRHSSTLQWEICKKSEFLRSSIEDVKEKMPVTINALAAGNGVLEQALWCNFGFSERSRRQGWILTHKGIRVR